MRRPLPKKAQDIGIWLDIIKALSRIGVITNAFIIAFTSDFIPRMVYQFVTSNDGTLKDYVNYSLSIKNMTEFETHQTKIEICSYRDLREPYNSPYKYEYTRDFYIVMTARLAFVVIFEVIILY